jgi:UDP-GlcNAc:undecaprenyl-phosphate/decaprenyl-phosphate GlcNAc-1-phosphate transferase
MMIEVKQVFSQYLPIFTEAFVLCLLLCVLALKFFPKWGLLDRPEKYGLKRKAIPYYGGILIFLTTMILTFVFVPLSSQLLALIIAGSVIVLLGFFDDLIGLSPAIRLFVQFFACLILIKGGIGILSINMPFFGILDFTNPVISGIHVLSALFTVLWVMSIVNTMNFVDGVSGLSSGVSFVAGLTIFFLSINSDLHSDLASQMPVAMIALILAASSLAFLLFDFPKPKILMGDTGSTFLGFMIAALAIFSGGKIATAFLVLGIPILDMLWVVLRRVWTGQKFWHGDTKHLHHRLLKIGFSEKKVVSLYLLITAFFGFTAVVLVNNEQKFFMLIALATLMFIFATALILVPKR